MKRTICTAVLLALAVLSTGCSVNVIVAPHAGLTVDSFKDGGGTNDTILQGDIFTGDAYGEDDDYVVLPQGQVL